MAAKHLLDYRRCQPPSPAKPIQAKTFEAVLERTPDRLRWVIAACPSTPPKSGASAASSRIQGEINGFAFRSTLFPDRQRQSLPDRQQENAVWRKDRAGAHGEISSAAGHRAAKALERRKSCCVSWDNRSGCSSSLNRSIHRGGMRLPNGLPSAKARRARQRRSQQIAERLMETMEAERELPPIMQLAFRQNPEPPNNGSACLPSHRRAHLLSIFHYRTLKHGWPIAFKWVEELLQRAEKRLAHEQKERSGTN